MGNQASTVETIVDGLLQTVLLNQNDHLPANKQSARSQTEFYLEAQLDIVHEDVDDNDRQADICQATFHQRSRIRATNLSLASDHGTGLRDKTETIIVLIFVVLANVALLIFVVFVQTDNRDYRAGDRTNTVFRYEFPFLVEQLDTT